MAKLTKRARLIREKVDVTKEYDISEAISLLKEFATAKFRESVDVAVNLGIDAKKSDQNVRGAAVLPNGTGREVRVAVFTQGANAEKAKEAGADVVGMEDLAEQATDDLEEINSTPVELFSLESADKWLAREVQVPRSDQPNSQEITFTSDDRSRIP